MKNLKVGDKVKFKRFFYGLGFDEDCDIFHKENEGKTFTISVLPEGKNSVYLEKVSNLLRFPIKRFEEVKLVNLPDELFRM